MGTHTYMGGEKGFLYIRASETPFFFCLTADRIFFWGGRGIKQMLRRLFFFGGPIFCLFVFYRTYDSWQENFPSAENYNCTTAFFSLRKKGEQVREQNPPFPLFFNFSLSEESGAVSRFFSSCLSHKCGESRLVPRTIWHTKMRMIFFQNQNVIGEE